MGITFRDLLLRLHAKYWSKILINVSHNPHETQKCQSKYVSLEIEFEGFFGMLFFRSSFFCASFIIIGGGSFIGMSRLVELSLNNNIISGINPHAFDGVESTLQHISLQNNIIKTFNNTPFSSLTSLLTISLHGNEITCSCHLLDVLLSLYGTQTMVDCFTERNTTDQASLTQQTLTNCSAYKRKTSLIDIQECDACVTSEGAPLFVSAMCSHIPSRLRSVVVECHSLTVNDEFIPREEYNSEPTTDETSSIQVKNGGNSTTLKVVVVVVIPVVLVTVVVVVAPHMWRKLRSETMDNVEEPNANTHTSNDSV